MTGTRWTKEGLPVIAEEIMDVVDRDLSQLKRETERTGEDSDLVYAWVLALRESNPTLYRCKNVWQDRILSNDSRAQGLGLENVSLCFEFAFTLAYELLRRQGEVYKLDDSVRK